jgi:hypothetical protein
VSAVLDRETDTPRATSGVIAVINLASARERSWERFWHAPERPGIAEYLLEQEHLTVQFLGDLDGLDRGDLLAGHLAYFDPDSPRTHLIRAKVAAMAHCFADARASIAQAKARGAPPDATERQVLSIDQACGTALDRVLAARRRIAASGKLDDLVPLGALLADLREFDAADGVYHDALRGYNDVSPFALALVCFQIGVLWGELVPERHAARAAAWYQRAIDYLPGYVKARVHLAELHLGAGRPEGAMAVLTPVRPSNDPEVDWRLADVADALDDPAAAAHREAARAGFERLLAKHQLAFTDHAAEFYAGSGDDLARALDLACINVSNRPTLRAFEQACAIAREAGDTPAAARLQAQAAARWGQTPGFRRSSLAASETSGASQ